MMKKKLFLFVISLVIGVIGGGKSYAQSYVDITSICMTNPSFETGNLTGWTTPKGTSSDTGVKKSEGNYATTGVDGTYLFNTWWKGVPIIQKIANMPNGDYQMQALIATSDPGADAKVFLLAQDGHSDVITIARGTSGTFNNYSYDFNVTTNDVTVGIIGGNDAGEYVDEGHWWYKVDHFRLGYKVTDDNADKLIAAIPTDKMSATASGALTSTKNDLQSEVNADNILALFTAIQNAKKSISLYTEINDMITKLKAQYAGCDFTTIDSKYDAGTYTSLNEVLADYTSAAIAALGTAVNTDYTQVIINPSFETGDLTGWSIENKGGDTGVKNNPKTPGTYYMDHIAGDKIFNTWTGGIKTLDISQTISGLPKGMYALSAWVSGYTDTDINLDVNGNVVKVKPEEGDGKCYQLTNKFAIAAGDDVVFKVTNTGKGYTFFMADDFQLTYLGDLVSDEDAEALLATLPADGSIMNGSVEAALNTAKTNFNNERTTDNYSALSEAITNANASIAAYAKAKTAIDRANAIKTANNFVTASATTTFANAIAEISDAYDTRTLTDEAATNAGKTLGSTVSNWQANKDGAAGKYLASAWGKTDGNWFEAPYINTWSVEGDNDGSGFSVPFFEYFTGDTKNLGTKTMTATLTGVENGRYEVEIWARVQRRTDADFNSDGSKITMSVNGGEAVSIMNSSNTVGTGNSVMRHDRYKAIGDVTDGTLTLSIQVYDGSNVHWLSWRDMKYTKLDQVNMEISDAEWATFIAPFEVTIPKSEGVKAYTVEGVKSDNETLNKTELDNTIPANTPVLLNGPEGTYPVYGINTATENSYTVGALTGVYTAQAAPKNSYVLQKQDGEGLGFYQVLGEEPLDRPTVGANRAYLTVPATAKMFSLDDDEGPTAIEGIDIAAEDYDAIYTPTGVKVESLQKGLNIVVKGEKSYKIFVK